MIELIIKDNLIKLHLDNFFAVLFAVYFVCVIIKNFLNISYFILEKKLDRLKKKIRVFKNNDK